MKSYYNHLQSIKSEGETVAITQKPVFRSSAIFPVIHNQHQSSKVIFMGYWLLKRGITEIGLLYTLRSADGITLSRKYMMIDKPKAYSIQLAEFNEVLGNDFTGSLELEIFSTRDLVFPYPAFVLVYFNENFSTAVHTVGRIYNDIEDLSSNEEYKVRESGFDIYANDGLLPFFAFTNGPLANMNPMITYEINNYKNEILKGEYRLEELKPFETRFVWLNKIEGIVSFLGSKAGSIKFGHNFEGFFPRFLAGNFHSSDKSISVTHSYYDCSGLEDARSYWNRKGEEFNDSSVSIPLFIKDNYYTRLAVYPIFSPSDFTLSFKFYSANGEFIAELSDYIEVKSDLNKYDQIDFGEIIKKEKLNASNIATVNIICNWKDKQKIPTRVKFGLNVGSSNHNNTLPSNICFAPQLGNPNILKKQGTFRWAPFINVGNSIVSFTNSSFEKNYLRDANVNLSFHREQDDKIIERTLTVKPNGEAHIKMDSDKELMGFFGTGTGWVAAQADNPFLNGFYFDFSTSGAVAADHIF